MERKPFDPKIIDETKSSLAAKLKKQLADGNISLSSSDLADFEQPEDAPKNAPVVGDVKTEAPTDMRNIDPMVATGAAGDTGQIVSERLKDTADTTDLLSKLVVTTTLPAEITVTETERNLFLDCIIIGKRFELPFSLFDGKVTGKFRSRSQYESSAILARLNWELDQKLIYNIMEYSARLRNMLMAAQVAEVRNTQYVPLQEPLLRTQSGEKITEPGWLDQVVAWTKEHEGLVTALYREFQLFEQKYVLMVNNASNQNFWRPAGSI